MPIDPNIPLQAKNPQIEVGANQLAMMNEAMKYNEMNRSIDTQNKLRDLYSQGIDVGTPEGFKQVAAIDPATALKLRTDALQGQKLQGDIKKTGLEITAKDMELARESWKSLDFNPSDNNFKAFLEDAVLNKKMTPAQAQQEWSQVANLDQMQRRAFIKNRSLAADKLFTQLETERSHKVTEGISAGHLQIAKENQGLQYGPDVVANTVTDAAGNVTQFNRQGQIIGKPGAVGKPSATFEKTAALQKQMGKDIDLAISEIKNAIKPGGTLDKSTASGAGKMLDAAGNFIGYATSGSIAAAELKPVGDLALKMVPRFEGPQSDKDTASYTLAAGQLANENLPIKTRRAAAETVVRIMERRKGQFVNQAMASEGINAGGPALPPGFTPDK